MIALPARMISAKAALYLAGALALSMAGNGWLFWKLAQAKPAAALKCVQADLAATVSAEAAEDARDAAAGAVARDTAQRIELANNHADQATDTAKQEIRYVYLTAPAPAAGSCTGEPPAGVRERLEDARQRANAAGR